MKKVYPKVEIIRNTQVHLYKNSGLSQNDDKGIIELIGPEPLARHLGLDYRLVDEIPSSDPQFKTAGLLDRPKKRIYISRRFPPEQRRLTGMHEVVHYMIHDHIGRDCLHRDRPVDSAIPRTHVDQHEWEATNIACLILMPEKMVKRQFAKIFRLNIGEPLALDEYASHHLDQPLADLRQMDVKRQYLFLSTTHKYIDHVEPLYSWFKVSPTAMAIRLEELNLIAPARHRGTPQLHIVT